MGTMNVIDILLAIKKRMQLVVIGALVCAILAYVAGSFLQSYTATMTLSYKHAGASEGLAPDGSALNAYEIMSPAVVSAALKDLDVQTDLTVEEVRNRLTVTEVVDSKTQEIIKASLEKGETYEYFPTEFQIACIYDAKYGAEFGNRLLYSLVNAYDEWFANRYYVRTTISDFIATIDVDSMDYMELCEFIEGNLNSVWETLNALYEEAPAYRSLHTGLNFQTLMSGYTEIKETDYRKYYANVREGLLTRDKEKLITTYEGKIDSAYLEMVNSQNDSDLAYEMVQLFYEQYKESNLYAQATEAQSTVTGSNSDNKTIVYDYDMSLMINTYDDIITRYVNSGVNATNLKHQSNYYQTLIDEFKADNVTTRVKNELLAKNEVLLASISQKVTKYAELANRTIADYYRYKTAQDLNYLMAIYVTNNISMPLIIAVGAVLGIAAASVLCIFIEMFHRYSEKKAAAASDDGALSAEVISAMTPIERALYEQSLAGFPEFYLEYQPLVDMHGDWYMSETFARWNSERLGEIKPAEFLPICEKYKLMDTLGVWTLRKVCEQLNDWRAQGIDTYVISVNYAVSQIMSATFVDSLCAVISETRAQADRLCFEISGGGEIEKIDYVAQKLKILKGMGALVAIDRFGDTLSSLRVLYELPVDLVKISKRYVTSLDGDSVDTFLISVIAICKELGIKIGMLGVENEEQRKTLGLLGMDYLQGYYFSPPLKIREHTDKMLRNAARSHDEEA